MGANEKFDAAMHGAQEHTPEPIDLRVAYRYMEAGLMMDPDSKPHDPVLMAESDAEFERFIAKVRAEAKAEALEEAADQVSKIDGREDRAARDWLRNRANQYKEAPSA